MTPFAPRLNFYRVPLCAPNWHGNTYRAVLRSLICGRVVDGPDLQELRSSLMETLGVAEALLCGSGSLALELALRGCGVGRNDEVILPSFCCTAVVPPILNAKAVPVFADVGEDLNLSASTVERVLTEKTRVIVVPHLFGNPADILNIVELVRGRPIHVIDDAAQAMGATIAGRPVGSFGDAGILSFGNEKVCFGIGGGVLISEHQTVFVDNLNHDLQAADLYTSIATFLSVLASRCWRRWTLPLQRLFTPTETADPDTPPSPYRHETMANLHAAVALSLLQSLPENIAARRVRVEAYHDLLGSREELTLVPHASGSACLTQVLRAPPGPGTQDRSIVIIGALRAAGYEVRGSYVPIHLISQYQRWARKPLLYTEAVWTDLIELPCEPSIRLDDVERIATIVKTSGCS